MPDDLLNADTQLSLGLDQAAGAEVSLGGNVKTQTLSLPDLWIKRRAPKPSEVFSTYWKFADRRQRIFFNRLFPDQNLLINDPILTRYKFTNAYRASDRVSQYLIKHVIYDKKRSREDQFFRILLFKFFNKIETWEALCKAFGDINWEEYSFKKYDTLLTEMMEQGRTIYSAAYIMPSGRSAFGHKRKHRNHLRIIEKMMNDRLPDRVSQQQSLASVFQLLKTYPCIGPFTGFQYAIDLNYSELINFSEGDFVEAGPGALDGIRKCFIEPGDYSPADIIRYTTDVQETAFESLGISFCSLWGRRLQLIDCQNLFCEVDKYSRVAHPNVAGKSGRKRIKQVYSVNAKPLEFPWYPPKWDIDTSSPIGI